jgi:Xaa-Pro aminopeptidase
MIHSNEFAKRRQELMSKMGNDTIAFLAAAPECIRNGDSDYLYRQNSDFYYLTGFSEPEAIAVFMPGRKQGEFILFNRVRDPLMETWHGKRAGQAGVVEKYGADQAFPISEFENKLPELLLGYEKIALAIGKEKEFGEKIISAIDRLNSKVRMGVVAPREFINIEQWLHPMRQIKSTNEIELMRKAATISAQAHRRAMEICKPGKFEYQLEAEMMHEFFQNGSRFPAYNSIIGSGENTCILHYNENNAELKNGDLVLIDAGCEYQNYASDITRTFPVNGKYSPEQRTIYEIVLKAQLAAIQKVRPGVTMDEVHMTALRILVEGLVSLHILKGNVDELISQKAYMPFYMHRTGHWIGLDVHDAGIYKVGGEWIPLKAGMVITVEPGLYISANPDVDKKWWNIGVRIEDDVLITETGADVLSKDIPKTIEEIEAIMGGV